jgi:outer membrane translocation and assembly module TamA
VKLKKNSPVTNESKPGARFNGNIEKVIVDLVGERHLDPEAEAKIAMKRQ